jgi:hypothetical protein
MKAATKFAILFVCSLMLLATFSPAFASVPMTMPGMVSLNSSNSNWYSSNWSGYAVNGSAGSVTSASGSWIVPTVSGGMGTAYAAFWTGIDGFSSSTVEQIGTLSQSSTSFSFRGAKTTVTYYAWYEFYPSESIIAITTATSPSGAPATVKPGDSIFATVTYVSGTTFTLTINDKTEGWTFTTTGSQPGATASSAEWVAEAPSSSTGVLPLANFGHINFGEDYTSTAMTCYATVNGVSGGIGSFLKGASVASSTDVQSITMATIMGFGRHTFVLPEATPSALSTDGTSFSITWNRA